jgi:hypothetical protein
VALVSCQATSHLLAHPVVERKKILKEARFDARGVHVEHLKARAEDRQTPWPASTLAKAL